MQYMGSKRRIAKEILPIILKEIQPNQWYIEPFVGGCNIIDKADHNLKIGADNNRYLIAMWKELQNGWNPPCQIKKEEYFQIKEGFKNDTKEYPDHLIGFVGFACSFRSKWWGGFSGNDVSRDYIGQAFRSIMKQVPNILNVSLFSGSYDSLTIPESSVIYCDPPYADTTKYGKDNFNSDLFWEWCREKVSEGHKVFVSEYKAPEDFVCIWEKEISCNLGGTSKTAIEKLFVHQSQF